LIYKDICGLFLVTLVDVLISSSYSLVTTLAMGILSNQRKFESVRYTKLSRSKDQGSKIRMWGSIVGIPLKDSFLDLFARYLTESGIVAQFSTPEEAQ
jgi:hypothetical protein